MNLNSPKIVTWRIIKNIYDKLINNKEEIKINQSYSLEEVLEGLFKDYFSLNMI